MPRKEFEPWFAVKVGIRQNHKIVDLSCDAARWGWVAGVMAEAKLQRPGGRFRSRAVLEEAIGRFAPYLDEYVAAGLLEVGPDLCDDCRKEVGDVADGVCIVHDWRHHQRDPDAAVRVAEWRAERGAGSSTPGESSDVRATYDGSTTDESSSERPANADSRGRARARETGTTDSRQDKKTDSPQPPSRAGGRSSRANGTSPRQLAKADADRVEAELKAKRQRRQRRENAYYGGLITEAQLVDMNDRDAPISELPTQPAIAGLQA